MKPGEQGNRTKCGHLMWEAAGGIASPVKEAGQGEEKAR